MKKFGEKVWLDISQKTLDFNKKMVVRGLTKRDKEKIYEIGYSTTYRTSDGYDILYMDKIVYLELSYYEDVADDDVTYFYLVVARDLDPILLKKMKGNCLNDEDKCLSVFLEWLNSN